MLLCKDCYTQCEGQEQHPHNPACDEYDGLEAEVSVDVYTGEDVPTVYELKNEMKNLYGALALLSAEVVEMQRKFDTIISAIVKATGSEEER